MQVLVTGSEGFIGTHVCRHFRTTGHHVVGVDRRPGTVPDHVRLDLTDPSARRTLTELVRGVDVVVHLAARPGVRDSSPDAEHARWRDNVVATRCLLAVTPPATPIVVSSSSSVYGGADRVGSEVRPSREDDPLRPRGGYARSKAEVERLCSERRASGSPVTVIRPFTVAGEGQRPDMALARWIDAARSGLPLRVLGSPDRVRDVTDVRDVARGIVRITESGYVGTVNLGTGTGHRLVDMVEAVLAVVGRPGSIVLEPAPDEEVELTLADTERTARVIGYVPVTDLVDVVTRQAAATDAPIRHREVTG